MQLFNQGKRTFVTVTGELKPQEVLEVEDKEGKRLVEMYPNELKALEVKKTDNKPKKEDNK